MYNKEISELNDWDGYQKLLHHMNLMWLNNFYQASITSVVHIC